LVPLPKPCSLAAQWQELEKKGLKSYTIGARVAAVVVNPKTGKSAASVCGGGGVAAQGGSEHTDRTLRVEG